jgi:hypothetical protein
LIDRAAFLNSLIGKRWAANARGPEAYDCFHLMAHIERTLAGRDVGDLSMPPDPSWSWMVQAVEAHPARKRWREVPIGKMGVVKAADLSVVLMARRNNPAHVGVWLKPETVVIHAEQTRDNDGRVVCDSLANLHVKGWQKLRFYEPI